VTQTLLFATLCVAAILAGGTVPATADVAAESQVDTSTWVMDNVPEVHLSLKYPGDWVPPPPSYTAPASTLLVRGSFEGGDYHLLAVVWHRDRNQQWFSRFKDFKKAALRATQTDRGQLLSVSKSPVGDLPAFSQVETYFDPQLKTRVVSAQIEIRLKDHSVVDELVELNAAPSAEATAKAILASVKQG
jgi:hypothetical protein